MKIKTVEKAIKEAKKRGHTEIAILGREMWTRKDSNDRHWEVIN